MKREIWIIGMILLMLFQTSCSYDDGDGVSSDIPDASAIVYSNTDYSVKFMKSIAASNAQNTCVYKDAVYYVDGLLRLRCVFLTDAEDGTNQKINMISSDCIGRVCTDPLCADDTPEGCLKCPAFLYSPDSQYLIDNSESVGNFPVFYYSRAISSSFDENEFNNGGGEHIVVGNYAIYRYDVSNNQRKVIVEQERPIISFSVYGDQIFFVTTDKDGNYKVVIADKSGKIKYETSELKNKIDLIGYENGTLYYADLEGNVYASSTEKKDDRLIFSVSSFVLLNTEATSSRMFIEQGFLYFDSELIYKETQIADAHGKIQTYNLPIRTIARISLSDPLSNAQVVAEDVFQSSVHGVCGGKLFYCKLTPGDGSKNGYWNFCGGDIYSVDLSTLQTELFANDIGMQFDLSMNYFSERFCVGVMAAYSQSYTEIYEENTSGSKFACCLYDFVTKQVYVLPI